MIATSSQLNIHLVLAPQDLRKSFNGLGAVVENELGDKLTDRALYIFTNKTRTRIKLLQFDGSGLWCAAKRLEQGNFSWPAASAPDQVVMRLTHQALQLILDGVQLRDGSLRPWYEKS